MRAAALRQQALALQSEIVRRREESASLAALAAEKLHTASLKAREAAELRAVGTTGARVQAIERSVRALRAEAADINNQARLLDKNTATMVAHLRELDRQSSELERAGRQQRQYAQALSSTASALGTVGVALAGTAAAMGFFFAESFKSFQEYERQVALTRTQIDGFSASMEQVGEVGLRIANEIPVAFEQIQPALFDIFSSTNANLQQSQILLEGFAKAAVAGQTDVQTAARGTIAIMNGLDIPFERVNEVLDIQFELVRKGVGTYEEFAKVFGRIIPAANRSQQSFETVAAMLAFMTRNGQSAAQAATAAARALELFTHPGAVRNLEQMGIKVRDLGGNYLPLIDILKQLRGELLKMPQADRVAQLVEVFKGSGFNIQARRFLEQVVLGAGELEDFQELLLAMGNASGVMGEKYAEMANTAAAKTQLLSNKWEILKIAVGEAVAPVFLKIIEIISMVLDKFNSLDPGTKRLITNVLMIATAVMAVIGVGLIFIGILAGIAAAIVAAGAELLIIVGILAAGTVALLAFGAAIIIAWREVESFRGTIRDTAADFQILWSAVEDVAGRISTAFNTHIAPPLEKLRGLMEDNVLPAVRKFRQEVADVVIPKVVEALRILGDIAEPVLAGIGKFIDTVVVPAVAKLSEWWEKNKQQLMPFIEVAAQIAKWLIIIAAVIIGSGMLIAFGSLIAVVAAVVAVFVLLIATVKFIKAIIGGFVDFLVSSSKAVGSTVINAWNSFLAAWRDGFNTAVEFVKGIVQGAIAFVLAIWNAFWSTFGEPIKAAWDLVKALIELGVALIMLPIEFMKIKLGQLWGSIWGAIGEPVTTAWNTVKSAVVDGFNAAWNWLSGRTTESLGFWRGVWDGIVETVSNAWNKVFGVVSGAIGKVVEFFRGLGDGILSKLRDIASTITRFFTDLAGDLFNSGAKIVQGIIDGITSRIKDLTNKVKEITQRIKDYLPSSPAKTGPLSGHGSPFKSGQAISDMVAAGMLDKLGILTNASSQVASAVATIPTGGDHALLAPVDLGAGGAAAFTPMKNNYVTVNVYTNEIDPRTTAAELGFELEGQL